MIGLLKIESAFDGFEDTAYWEKYMLNAFQFSAAKSVSELKMLQGMVFGDGGKKIPFEQFRELATPILKQFNEVWLRVEYDLAARGAVMAQRWQELYKDRDLFPTWVFRTRRDDRVRPEHADLEGKVFRLDDTYAQQFWPPLGWNCFHGDMLVTTYDGQKPIKDITAGEFVLTRKGYKRVFYSWCNGVKKVHKVTFLGDQIHTFYSTDTHKVYTKELDFIEINKLKHNVLYTFIDADLKEFKAYIHLDAGGFETDVYDLMIDEQPEFFVNKILVHNCRCEGEQSSLDGLKRAEMELLTHNIEPGFEGNVGIDGVFPITKAGSSYYEVLKNANAAKPEMFVKAPEPVIETVHDKVLKVEKEIRNNKYETLIVFDKSGKEIFNKKGSESNVSASNEETKNITKDAIFTHNHPSALNFPEKSMRRIGQSFSIDDIKSAARFDAQQMRAVTPSYTFIMERPDKGWPTEITITKTYNKINNEVFSDFKNRIDNEITTINQAQTMHWHTVNKKAAKKLGMKYSKFKNDE